MQRVCVCALRLPGSCELCRKLKPTMKTPNIITWFLSTILFFATALCLSAAEQSALSESSGSTLRFTWIQILLVVLVPLLIAGLKYVWPTVPRSVIPLLCPALGYGIDRLATLSGLDIGSTEVSAASGALGLYARELLTQLKRALTELAASPIATAVAVILFLRCVPAGAQEMRSGVPDFRFGPPTPNDWLLPAEVDTRFSLSPFASYRVHEFGSSNGKFGGGLAAGFALNPRLTLEAEAIGERFDDSHWIESLTEAGANLKFALPSIWIIGPYGLLGYTRNLDVPENRMNAGAGVELKFHRNAAAFVDGRWTHDFKNVGHALFRAGLSVKF
jgi:hypothetical protein